DYSDEVASRIDAEVRRLVDGAHRVAREILETNRSVLDRLSDELLRLETVDLDQVQQIFAPVQPFTGSGTGRAAAAAASDVSSRSGASGPGPVPGPGGVGRTTS